MHSAAGKEIDVVTQAPPHRPVMSRQVVEALRPGSCTRLADATLGAGGHAEALLEELPADGRLYGVDRDPSALDLARDRLRRFGDRFVGVHGRYEDFSALLRNEGAFVLDGVVADLGLSSMQLDDPRRGFSFREDGPLDMRMDPGASGPTAADLVAGLPEAELRRILRIWGEERQAGSIARAIVRRRAVRPIERTVDLAGVVERAAGGKARRYRIHPATRTFQALRIAVNGEIEGIEGFVNDAVSILRRGGRIAVISFHSIEDRAVKRALRALANRCVCPPDLPVCGCGLENVLRMVTTKPLRPSAREIEDNPRSRSARLRVAERI
jgi:16S rRNA (cytosine1402-N4)-methyltransferase